MKSTPEEKFTKKQHYVPQFYLKNFSHDGERLYIYDKKEGQIRYQTTINIAHENNFYTFNTKSGEKRNLEKLFNSFEGNANEAIKLAQNEMLITESDKEAIALFVAFQDMRTPANKSKLEEMHTQVGEKVSRMAIKMTPIEKLKIDFKKKIKLELSNEETEDMKDFATNPKRSRIRFEYPNGWWLKTMLEMAMATVPAFMTMDWHFLYTDRKFAFITNDNPLMVVPPKNFDRFWGIGLLTPGVKRIIPLTSNLCLMMGEMSANPKIEFKKVGKEFFREVNEHLISGCKRFCFSPDKGKLEKLVKTVKPHKLIDRPKNYVN